MPDWVGVDRRSVSLDKGKAVRAVVVSAETYSAALTAAARQLGLSGSLRGNVHVAVVVEDESVADAVVRVKQEAASRSRAAVGPAPVAEPRAVAEQASLGAGREKWDST